MLIKTKNEVKSEVSQIVRFINNFLFIADNRSFSEMISEVFRKVICVACTVLLYIEQMVPGCHLRRAWARRIYLWPSFSNTCACGTFRSFPFVHIVFRRVRLYC